MGDFYISCSGYDSAALKPAVKINSTVSPYLSNVAIRKREIVWLAWYFCGLSWRRPRWESGVESFWNTRQIWCQGSVPPPATQKGCGGRAGNGCVGNL